jgi:hypothetical protein
VGTAKSIHFFQAIKKNVSWEGYAPEGYQDDEKNLVSMPPNLQKKRPCLADDAICRRYQLSLNIASQEVSPWILPSLVLGPFGGAAGVICMFSPFWSR